VKQLYLAVKPHDPVIIRPSFDALPACNGQTDRQTDKPTIAESHSRSAERDRKPHRLLVENRYFCIPRLHSSPPICRNFATIFRKQALAWLGYHKVKSLSKCSQPFWYMTHLTMKLIF